MKQQLKHGLKGSGKKVRKVITVDYAENVEKALQLTLQSNGYDDEQEFFRYLIRDAICGYIEASNSDAYQTFNLREYHLKQGY